MNLAERASAGAFFFDQHLRKAIGMTNSNGGALPAFGELVLRRSVDRIEALVEDFTVVEATDDGDGIWRIPNPCEPGKPHFFADVAATESALTTIAAAYAAGLHAHCVPTVADQRHAYLFYGALLAEISGLAAHLADRNSRQVQIIDHGAHLDVLAQIVKAVAGAEVLVRDSQAADESEAATL